MQLSLTELLESKDCICKHTDAAFRLSVLKIQWQSTHFTKAESLYWSTLVVNYIKLEQKLSGCRQKAVQGLSLFVSSKALTLLLHN